MSSILESFKDLMERSSSDEKHLMLDALLSEIKKADSSFTITPNVEHSPSFDDLVSTSENVISDKKFLLDLHKELESLGLYSPSSRKPTSMWFSVDGCPFMKVKTMLPTT